MSLSILLTAYFWAFLLFWAGSIAWIFVGSFLPRQRRQRDFTNVAAGLARLLRCGYAGGHLRVTHDQSARFLEFHKYIHAEGDYGIEMHGSMPDWTAAELAALQACAADLGLPSRRETENTTDAGAKAVIVDCGRSTDAAYDLAVAAWTEILGLSIKAPYRTESGNCSALDELIDRPDYPPPYDEALETLGPAHVAERFSKAGMPSLSKVLLATALVLIFIPSAIGLPVSMLLARGAPADWTLPLAALTFEGSTASLAFLASFLLSRLWINMLRFKTPSWARYKVTWGKRAARLLAASAPFAVLLAWAGF